MVDDRFNKFIMAVKWNKQKMKKVNGEFMIISQIFALLL